MTYLEAAIVLVKVLTLFAGGAIAHFSYKAYVKTDNAGLGALCAGFTAITAGAVFGGFIDVGLSLDIRYGVLVQSVLTFLGFVVILYSLFLD